MTTHVDPADVDALGHVNNIVYIRWVQDVAVAHCQLLAPASSQTDLLWMVVRHVIDYKYPARPEVMIFLRTWVGNAEGLRFERHTSIHRAPDDRILVQARILRCPVDPTTHRSKRVSGELRNLFTQG